MYSFYFCWVCVAVWFLASWSWAPYQRWYTTNIAHGMHSRKWQFKVITHVRSHCSNDTWIAKTMGFLIAFVVDVKIGVSDSARSQLWQWFLPGNKFLGNLWFSGRNKSHLAVSLVLFLCSFEWRAYSRRHVYACIRPSHLFPIHN